MTKAKIQFDSGNMIYDVQLWIPLNFKGTLYEIDQILKNHMDVLEFQLKIKCGYLPDGENGWVLTDEPILHLVKTTK